LPQYFWENGWADDAGDSHNYREIICTQPRRIAAITLSNRLQSELPDPSLVGYSVRFASTYQPGVTKIRYVTDGWLLREVTLLNPLLKQCSVLIIDEAHERSINTELLMGTVKKIRRMRPELRVIVCSATLDAEMFLEFFAGKNKVKKVENEDGKKKKRSRWGRLNDDAKVEDEKQTSSLDEGTIISVDGRLHPVDIMYSQQPVADYIKSSVEVALQIHDTEHDDGDILCFLPTGEDIDEAVEMTENLLASMGSKKKNAVCLPLYSALPPKLQQQPFLPRSTHEMQSNTRRIIFATNIAETSVTVPNIAHVIDCGFAKMPFFDPFSGFDRLIVCPISKANARQRAGRAGRVRPGKCYRLYSEEEFDNFDHETAPEIQRSSLTSLILLIKSLGVKNVLSFDLMSVPTVEALSHGLESLYALGAMDDAAELSVLGKEM
jgi:ATP-dependent RNA helicase DDX35